LGKIRKIRQLGRPVRPARLQPSKSMARQAVPPQNPIFRPQTSETAPEPVSTLQTTWIGVGTRSLAPPEVEKSPKVNFSPFSSLHAQQQPGWPAGAPRPSHPKISILLPPDFPTPGSDFGHTVFVHTPKGALGAHTLSEPIPHSGERRRGSKVAKKWEIHVLLQ